MSDHGREERSCSATPLLFLLDGVLSQDEARTAEALDEMRRNGVPVSETASPLSEPGLCEILETLLSHCPALCSVKSEHDGSLPLHFAASLGIVSCAQIIYSKYPQAASTPNQKGKIPLHYAAREGRLDMVKFFLSVAPETARIPTAKAKLALHFAAGEGHSEIVSELLKAFPKSAQLASSKGKLPLHFCARWGYVNVAQELLNVYPEAIKKLDWEGSLPLHDAAREGQVDMAKFLIEKYPRALQASNLRNEVPLFAAVRTNNMDLVVLMIQSWPLAGKQILKNTNQDDNIESWDPQILELLLRGAVNNLDCELIRSAPPSSVQLLDDVSDTKRTHKKGKSSRCKSPKLGDSGDELLPRKRPRLLAKRSFIPLHAALEAQASCHVIEHLLKQHPGMVGIVDDVGRFPLHWAVCHPGLAQVLLNESYGLMTAEMASHRDQFGNLPLHLALINRCHVDVIKKLLLLNPESGVDPCGIPDFRDKRPLDMATFYNCDLSTVFELLKVDPNYVSR